MGIICIKGDLMHFDNLCRKFYNYDFIRLYGDDSSTFYELKKDKSISQMKVYTIFDGIEIMFNNSSGEGFCTQKTQGDSNLLCIAFCLNGNYKITTQKEAINFDKYTLGMCNMDMEFKESKIPSGQNSSIQFLISLDSGAKEIQKILKNINLHQINEKIIGNFLTFNNDKTSMKILCDIHNSKSLGVDYLRVKFLELILHLSGSISELNRAVGSKNLIKEIDEYIEMHCDEPILIKDLCEKFSFSCSKLQKDFSKAHHLSLYQYIKYQKIQKAISMLGQNDKNITQIASAVGYTNISKFCESFKKITGKTPLEFKKSSDSLV